VFLAVVVVAAVVRTLPFSLHGVEALADHTLRVQIRKELLAQNPRPATPEAADLDKRLEAWIAANGEAFATRKSALAERLRAERRLDSVTGHLPYLGGMDGYYWSRQARNRWLTGTVCDAVDEGECRDTYTHASLGRPMAYPHSAHAVAISTTHGLAVLLDSAWPLFATSFVVSFLVAVLGLLAAFALGCRFGGTVAGFVAAFLLAVNPSVLLRGLGADNDDWNVSLPLLALWALLAGARAESLRGRCAGALAAAAVVAVHSATWNGWLFGYAILLLGLLGGVLLQSVRAAIRGGVTRLWRAPAVVASVVIALVFFVSAGVMVTMAQSSVSYWTVPGKIVAAAMPRLTSAPGGADEAPAAPVAVWPSTLRSVRELTSSTAWYAAGLENGLWLFCSACLGVLTLAARGRPVSWSYLFLLAAALSLAVLAVTVEDVQATTRTALVLFPIAAALLLRLRAPATIADDIGAVCVAIWFVAGLHKSHEHLRFGLLLAPPLALSAAIFCGRACDWLRRRVLAPRLRRPWATTGVLATLTLLFVTEPARQGSAVARRYLPQMTDVWWQALTHVRDETAPEAVIHTWWDYGYWVKYVAERRVTADGGSLRTHIPQWSARALLGGDERESIGILRMLNCGSDAAPYPEQSASAYRKLQDAGLDGIAAHGALIDLAGLDRTIARDHLVSLGLPAALQAEVLEATHCDPPPAYLMLSSKLAANSAWIYLGDWSFERAYIANHVRHWPRERALRHLTEAFQYSEAKATSLYDRANSLRSDGQRDAFVAPAGGYLTREWMPCTASATGSLVSCPLDIGIGNVAAAIDAFEYPPEQPRAGALRLRDARSGSVRYQHGSAAVVMVADAEGIRITPAARPTYPMLAVLVDAVEERALVGTPNVLRSILTQLAFLDGRYSRFFDKFDERSGADGERVTTWRIHWQGRPAVADERSGSGPSLRQ
jgi:hypothetical protein